MVYQNKTANIFYDEDRRFDSPPVALIVMTTSVMLTVLICSNIKARFQFTVPRKLPLLLISIIFGLLVNHVPHLYELRLPHTGFPPRQLLAYYIPAYCLRTIHKYKKPTFRRYLLVYCIMSFIPLLSAVMHACVFLAAVEFKITLAKSMLFSIIFSSIQPFFIMSVISGLDNFKIAHSMLQGEALIAVNWCMLVHKIILIILTQNPTLDYLILAALKSQVGAIALGYFFAKSMTIPLSYINFDANATAGLMLGTMVVAYCIADITGVAPYLTCLVISLIASYDKCTFDTDIERETKGILEVLYTLADLGTYSYCILKITVESVKAFTFSSMHLYFFNYITIIITRFVSFLLVLPIIKKILPSFTFNHVLVLTTGNVVGNIPLILNIVNLHNRATHAIAELLLPFMLTDALLTTILNNAGMSVLMSFINAKSISTARISSVVQCLEAVAEEREKIINTVKLKRYMADVNWKFVRKVTSYKLPHPYPEPRDYNPSISDARSETFCCENCPLLPELHGGNRPKKLLQYKRNAKKKLLLEMKLIAKAHCEKRLISKQCLIIIENIFDEDHTDQIRWTIDYEMLKKYFAHNQTLKFLTTCYRNIFELKMAKVLMPRAKWRRVFYYILCNIYFRIFISIIIVGTIVDSICDIFGFHKFTSWQELIFDSTILVIYSSEFVITIIAYSWIYWSEGFLTYFSSHWHIIDFVSLVITVVIVLKDSLLFLMKSTKKNQDRTTRAVLDILNILPAIRGLRIFQIISEAFPSLLNKLQQTENERVTLGFELSKEIVECINEIMLVADRFVDSKETRENLLESFQEVRMNIYKLLLETKFNSPWIATTMETKQLINASKYVMRGALLYLKHSGLVDTTEYLMINKSIMKNDAIVKNMVKIPGLSINKKLSFVWWLENDANMLKYFLKHAVMEHIPAGEIICSQGQHTDGIYVVLLGMIRIKYEPSHYVIDRLTEDGYLPIVDNISTTRFEEPTQIFVVPGNSMGELGFLTGRYSDCEITSLTDVKLCVIRREYVEQYIKEKLDAADDLESRLWKYATVKLATAILISTTTHQAYTIYDIKLKLQRSFVPNLTFYSYFVVTDQMEDIILLEGLVVDFYARDVYIAPCYIPRCILKFEIPKHSFINKQEKLQTKLLIIPTLGTDNWSMMELEEELAELEPQYRKYMRFTKKRKKTTDRYSSRLSQASVL